VVCFVPEWTCPVRANTDHHIVPITCGAWSPSGIGLGTDPLPAVRHRPAEADQTSPVGPPCLCRQHQIYGCCRPSSINCLADRVSACIDEVSSWMRSNWLQVRQRCSGVLPVDVSTRFRPRLCVSAALMYYRSLPFMMSGST